MRPQELCDGGEIKARMLDIRVVHCGTVDHQSWLHWLTKLAERDNSLKWVVRTELCGGRWQTWLWSGQCLISTLTLSLQTAGQPAVGSERVNVQSIQAMFFYLAQATSADRSCLEWGDQIFAVSGPYTWSSLLASVHDPLFSQCVFEDLLDGPRHVWCWTGAC